MILLSSSVFDVITSDTQFGKITLYFLIATILFFLINIFINNLFFDILCGIVFSVTTTSIIQIKNNNLNFKSDFYKLLIPIMIVYFIVYILFYIYFIRFAESSNTFSKDMIEGEIAKVCLTIPEKGVGEITLTMGFQTLNYPARIFIKDNNLEIKEIKQNTKVLIVEFKEDTAYVIPYEPLF